VASDPQLRSARLPSQQQVIELLDGEFARAGYEIEDVVIDARARPPRITVIADGDDGLDLNSIAALSRSASELLDTADSSTSGSEYVLEVTLSDGSLLTGRLGETRDGAVHLVVPQGAKGDYSVRELPLDGIAKAVVQVEFSTPNQRELDLAGNTGKGAGA
jgi:ribosome maturation factor RimP